MKTMKIHKMGLALALVLVPSVAGADFPTGVTTANAVACRAGPDGLDRGKGEFCTTIPAGTQVFLNEEHGQWVRIGVDIPAYSGLLWTRASLITWNN
jgi:hypothetical protein